MTGNNYHMLDILVFPEQPLLLTLMFTLLSTGFNTEKKKSKLVVPKVPKLYEHV